MPQNDWPDFATNPGAAILTQSAYAALPDMVAGVPNGVWDQQNINAYLQHALKAMSIIAAINNAAGLDAINATDGSHTAITANFLTAMSGRYTGFQLFATPGSPTYTPTAGTKKILIKMIGAGGGGGGCSATAAGQFSTGAAGGAGAYAEHSIAAGLASSYALVIGAAGSGGATAGAGGNGGTTQFGAIITCTGGNGGGAGGPVAFPATGLSAGLGGTASGANIINAHGPQGKVGYGLQANQCIGAGGADSYYGGGGPIVFGAAAAGLVAVAGGAGGGAGFSNNGGAAQVGGGGGGGSIIIYEFA